MTGTETASVFEPRLGHRSEDFDYHWERCALIESFKAWAANIRNDWTDDLYSKLKEGAD